MYDKIIYVSHPYGGREENMRAVEELTVALQSRYPSCLFLSPIHCFGFMYSKVDYADGLQMCLAMLEKSDEMWVAGDWKNSRGCNAEVKHAYEKGIPVRFIKDGEVY